MKFEKPIPKWYFTILILFVVFEYTRPQTFYLTFLAPLKLPMFLTLTMAWIFLSGRKSFLKEEKVIPWVLAFAFIIGFSVIYSTNNRAAYNQFVIMFFTLIGFVFPLLTIVREKFTLYRFFNWWLVVQTFVAIQVIILGGHGAGNYLYDENDAALCLVMALPFAIYMQGCDGITTKDKLLYSLSMLLIMAAIGITASRGGLVGLAVVGLVVLVFSKNPIRNGLLLTALLLMLGGAFVALLPDGYVADMVSMSNPEDRTRDERLWSWSIGWEMFKRNLIFGVGAGNYPWTNHLYAEFSPMYDPHRKILGGRVAHSLYFTLLPELGLIGIIIYGGIVRSLFRCYRDAVRYQKAFPSSEDAMRFLLLFRAMFVSAIGFFVSGAFISVLYYPPFWHLLGLVVVTHRVARLNFPGFSVVEKNKKGLLSNEG